MVDKNPYVPGTPIYFDPLSQSHEGSRALQHHINMANDRNGWHMPAMLIPVAMVSRSLIRVVNSEVGGAPKVFTHVCGFALIRFCRNT
jgi:hypothetical protein